MLLSKFHYICELRFSKALKVFKLKDLEKTLSEKGFYFHHQKATHRIYSNADGYYVTIPIGSKGEVNAMMSTVSLQRINHGTCRRLDKDTFQQGVSEFYKQINRQYGKVGYINSI